MFVIEDLSICDGIVVNAATNNNTNSSVTISDDVLSHSSELDMMV